MIRGPEVLDSTTNSDEDTTSVNRGVYSVLEKIIKPGSVIRPLRENEEPTRQPVSTSTYSGAFTLEAARFAGYIGLATWGIYEVAKAVF